MVEAGANVHNTKLLVITLDSIMVNCPAGHQAVAAPGYRGHIRRIGEERLDAKGEKRYPARRWVVKRTSAWLSRCRANLVSHD